MRKVMKLVVFVAVAGALTGCGSVQLKSGSLEFLRNEKLINMEYTYENMRVGAFVKEEDYLAKRSAEIDKKEPGRGKLWRQAWIDDRTRRFQPKFEDLLNKYVSKGGMDLRFGNFKDAKHTLVLNTSFIEPGFNVGIMRRPAIIDTEATFVETQNRVNKLAVVSLPQIPGQDAMGWDFDTGQRIGEAYAKTGKELAKFICDKSR